ncbi:MAG: antibiotic biosynthesis monooxygenase [Chitinophagaceae bacterium]|nr:antibiotic biosynthesis monooxygenase [Chitinophagaceae bacterium]
MQLPEKYYAVIFTSIRTHVEEGYESMAAEMEKLASQQAGFLGIESARSEIGITVSYWKNLEAIQQWKKHSDHVLAQRYGREKWYSFYKVRICCVEREYEFGEGKP